MLFLLTLQALPVLILAPPAADLLTAFSSMEQKVYAVDVAYGQLDWKLRQDERVVVIERFNAREICREQVPDPIDLAVMDAAFISVTRLIPPLLPSFPKRLP